jgi:2-iminobutanoate/2-iminopropanoate deaminase
MPLRPISTPAAPKPFSNYSQAVAIEAPARILHVAGQVGCRIDGSVPGSEAEQHELAWANVLAILAADGMDHTHLVDCHVYITDPQSIALYRETRDRMLKGAKPAATLLIVAGLASPAWKVEVSVVAAK